MTDVTDTPAVPARSRVRVLVALAAILVVLAAVGVAVYLATKDHPKNFGSARDIQTELKAGGFDCVAWTDTPKEDRMWGAVDQGTCWVNGDSLTIALWDSPEAAQNAEQAGEMMGRALGIEAKGTRTDVNGGAWSVEAGTQARASKVQAILGGDIR